MKATGDRDTVAATTSSRFASAADVTGDVRAALIDLLYRLADDHLIIGHRNSEWTGLGPILEADIAMSSIAQDQMGQAQAYYRLLHELGEDEPDALVFARGPAAYRCASLVSLDKGDWAVSVVRQYLYDAAKELRLEAGVQSAYVPLAQLSRKLRGEQKYHMMHSTMWVTRLGSAKEESHQRMQSALDELYPHALGLFEPTACDADIAGYGFGPREGDLCERWRERMAATLRAATLVAPQGVKPAYGGRTGKHPDGLVKLLDAMQKVFRLDPTATW